MTESSDQSVTVLLFAGAKAAVEGKDSVEVLCGVPCTVSEFTGKIASQFPELAPLLAHSRLAIGDEYAAPNDLMDFTRQIAVIPPVSGG